MKRIPFITIALVFLLPASHADDNWPQFRGAEARGIGADGKKSAVKSIDMKYDIARYDEHKPKGRNLAACLQNLMDIIIIHIGRRARKRGMNKEVDFMNNKEKERRSDTQQRVLAGGCDKHTG